MRHLATVLGVWLLASSSLPAAEPVVRLVDFSTTVNPVSAYRITQAIDDAEAAGDDFVLIVLDTPGGLVSSMDRIVKRMLNAKVPVVVWVGPSGARAASAGFFILMAADVAAMAPGTRTGAASTIFGTGEGSEDNVALKKANQDNAALCRSVAQRRGRSVEACEGAVFSATAYEESVALEKGLIELIADSRDALLTDLDGREVHRFDGTAVTLHTAGARFVESEFPLKQRFMELLAVPLVAVLLLLIGVGGLWIEFTHPGVVLPGLVGALSLLLFLLAGQVLPVSAIGVLLILLAVVMFVLEIKVISHGMLTLGGVICLVLGSSLLIDGPIPELRVPLGAVLPMSLTVALICAVALRLAVRAQRARVATGVEGLVGELGATTEPLEPTGRVRVHGELWTAVAEQGPIAAGSPIEVVSVRELTLTVRAARPAGGGN